MPARARVSGHLFGLRASDCSLLANLAVFTAQNQTAGALIDAMT
jgi:hypothetical protein